MNVLFLTVAEIQAISSRGIYTDLLREFRDRGDHVCVVCPSERRHGRPTTLSVEDGITVLRVRTGNITKTHLVEKVISTILIENQFISAIKSLPSSTRFDLVLYSSPPVTFDRVVDYVRRRDRCKSYLLLKDIFPQNAVDLGMMSKGGLPWRYFRSREKRLYSVSDYIGCMSQANVRHLLANNIEVPSNRVEECANSIKPLPVQHFRDTTLGVRDELGIPQGSMLLVYGGNLGKPQGLGFLLDIMDRAKDMDRLFFLIVGSGTEYPRIEAHLRAGQHRNVRLMKMLPKDKYDALLGDCDVGLIFLDPRFTIPNFPSRLTAYMEASIPVLAATDANTDLRDVLLESGSGLWVENGDVNGFMSAVEYLLSHEELRREMGRKGREYLEEYYSVAKSYETITAHVKSPF